MFEQGTFQVIKDVEVGKDTKIWHFVNLYDCKIGDSCMIGSFVEIQDGVEIGNHCRVQSHTFICSKVRIGNNVFIGHGVMFINDPYPPSSDRNWKETIIEDNVSIGSNATILPVRIGKNAVIGAGAVVIRDVAENEKIVGHHRKI